MGRRAVGIAVLLCFAVLAWGACGGSEQRGQTTAGTTQQTTTPKTTQATTARPAPRTTQAPAAAQPGPTPPETLPALEPPPEQPAPAEPTPDSTLGQDAGQMPSPDSTPEQTPAAQPDASGQPAVPSTPTGTDVPGLPDGSCPDSFPVKGNVSASGELIYHVPGGAFYGKTKPEQCFATEQDAQNAGYRKSKR